MRSLAGGLAGGFIGALLFRSLGFGGGFGSGGFGGIGLFEIILLGLGVFIIYKLVKSKKTASAPSYSSDYQRSEQSYDYQPVRDISTAPSYEDDLSAGLSRIRQFDPNFDENRFKETAADIFFKVQAAWMNRDIDSFKYLFAPEILETMRNDVAKMKSEGRVNRLENIAMRGAEITEAWQEQGKDYITVELTANVLDYVTDETGRLLEGSRTEPVKFLEYWTFVRPVGTGSWQLTAIQQAE
ncbi:MAG: Tim44 domain-containing protein [Nitrospirae bacterium]|nr:Tim44 domain-containing protein [Nitrospirota bacterium]